MNMEDLAKLAAGHVWSVIKERISLVENYVKDEFSKNSDHVRSLINESIEKNEIKIEKLVQEKFNSVNLPKDGKDALDIRILPDIDFSKSYDVGVYARHKGGLWKSVAHTNGALGWQCIVEGIDSISFDFDGDRDLSIKLSKSTGDIVEKSVRLNVPIYKEVWKPGEYEKGDVVTHGGSQWTCVVDKTVDKPGESSSGWKLSVKAGRNGKDIVKIQDNKFKTVKIGETN